ncbi:helix-turn-helix transcriptional regulator [Haloarcula amylovorans]|uniref:helix-turn-helix transcriptional regulator n=1 Tax=Haloarcula amylovorans TaxID=2562280 RepID=UPI001FD79D6C|nr:helix-turn-helix transcriptional regulator [Halomicroarcula amylolytica]
MSTNTQSGEPMTGQSGFQRDLLVEIRDQPGSCGLDLKDELKAFYENVSNARLYQNLSSLVEDGLVEKEAADKRSDAYRLTNAGRQAIEDDLAYRDQERGAEA